MQDQLSDEATGGVARSPRIDAIIPALDEERSLPAVIAAARAAAIDGRGGRLRQVVVVDNGSTDGTAGAARAAGAMVVAEPRRGYGAACLAGLAWLRALPEPPDVVVFLDGDGADDAGDLAALLAPLTAGAADLVIGSRTLGRRDRGALTLPQRAGNAVAAALIGALYRQRTTDLGPLRAVRFAALLALGMRDRDYGWTVEMQVKALRGGLRVVEIPVRYHRRTAGRSKVSGTLRGALGAGFKILATIARHAR